MRICVSIHTALMYANISQTNNTFEFTSSVYMARDSLKKGACFTLIAHCRSQIRDLQWGMAIKTYPAHNFYKTGGCWLLMHWRLPINMKILKSLTQFIYDSCVRKCLEKNVCESQMNIVWHRQRHLLQKCVSISVYLIRDELYAF